MPLLPGKDNIGQNIETEMDAGKKRRQAIAIALSVAGRTPHRDWGGGVNITSRPPWYVRNEAHNMARTGPLMGATPGRADKLPMSVPNGSHVIPADTVSALGSGNSMNGHAVLSKMFPMSTGPLGMPMTIHSAKPNFPKLPKFPGKKHGGEHHSKDNVAVKVSDGEHIIGPDDVRRVGGGDIEKGHKILDEFILHIRKQNIKALRKMPPPAKD
jgi:hypothetical protein